VGRVAVSRETLETRIRVFLEEGAIGVKAETPIPMLNHLLKTLLFYAGIGGEVYAEEVYRVDDHHVAEDVALVLGEALRRLTAGRTIARYGWSIVPMDESLCLAAVDVSNRPGAWVELGLQPWDVVGGLRAENAEHFIASLASTLRATIHVKALRTGNTHHTIEACFKALGMALGQALRGSSRVMSIKGVV